MNESSQPKRVAAVVLLRDDGAALLQLRDDKPGLPRAGMWVMPGGHCDPGETMEDCARREFLEETDYDCHDLKFLARYDDHDPTTDRHFDLHLYWARYDGRQPYCCREGQDLRFVPRQGAEQLNMPRLLIACWDASLALAGCEIDSRADMAADA
ncbi:MAG: NUDIX hydrolase [Pirellulaceae bacterium]